ncbi:hypothetical protein [Natrinema sp. 1APR25-10V2]|uniref:hypothetical protein n=1 Tax=Natrinema sp. 1APR25-10V2 TaxID=2951081 RepID=UPI002876DF13|nr:hypothetical protein [Natrinema sp. 1APR25-10V2]MDS0474068.1 hypothetical protein [Natrinema sp. 1APR25-10V2]
MDEFDEIVFHVPDKGEAEALLVDAQHSCVSYAHRVKINRAILAVAVDHPEMIRGETTRHVLDDAFTI